MLDYTEEQMNAMLAEEAALSAQHRMILEANIDSMKLTNESDSIDDMVGRLTSEDWNACKGLQICGEML